MDSGVAYQRLTGHRHFAYRGCAPDTDQPTRAAGNLDVPVDAWLVPDVDGGETRADRIARQAAAKAVCRACPVLEVCRTYGASLDEEGSLAEPYAILGAQTALERTRALVAERQAAPVSAPARSGKSAPVPLTSQKVAVLHALAGHCGMEEVADAAGVDVRTANWQRSILRGQLGLPRGASRMELLAAARRRGLLDEGVLVVGDDGSVPAAPRTPRPKPATAGDGGVGQEALPLDPTTTAVAPADAGVCADAATGIEANAGPGNLNAAATDLPDNTGTTTPPAATGSTDSVAEGAMLLRPVRVRAPRRGDYTHISGQLPLPGISPPPDLPDAQAAGRVRRLPHRADVLEAAA
ncbi:hypothetical protein [Streptomyces sp. NPDC008150]|uniref:hypothetical protein n=1 Tax=Streptomyces sp. NPDC008150 TaxID=3364816 RepID=UPI0036E0FB11